MIASNVYLAGFLKTSRSHLPSSGGQFFRSGTIFKEANIKTKSATIAFSPYPPFVLLANTIQFFFISLNSVVFGYIGSKKPAFWNIIKQLQISPDKLSIIGQIFISLIPVCLFICALFSPWVIRFYLGVETKI